MPTKTVNQIELHYEIYGEGDPLLFIHGLGSSTQDWQNQIDYFSKKHQVILFDVRGHGQSEKPPGPYSIPVFAEDTATLIEHLNVGPLPIVGLSMGGMIALQLTIDRPDLVSRLVTVNCLPEFVPRTAKERLNVWQRFFVLRILGMQKIGKILSKRMFPKPEHAHIRDTFVRRWSKNDPRAYRDAMRAIVGWSIMDQIENISCPALTLASNNDYSSVAEKQAFTRKLKQGRIVVIDDARHALPVERPDEFNAALDQFLSE